MIVRKALLVAPAEEPVSLAETLTHLRADAGEDFQLVARCIQSARRWAEHYTRRVFVSQTWDAHYSAWGAGGVMTLPVSPLISVTSVAWRNINGISDIFPAVNYVVDDISENGAVVLLPNRTWPSETLFPLWPITIRAVAGYGSAADVPADIKAAILLLVGHLYENRENAQEKQLKTMPFAAENLLKNYIAGWF